MEIYGSEGTLVASGADSPQLSDGCRSRARKRGNTLAPMPVPRALHLRRARHAVGRSPNVGQMYTVFARAIGGGKAAQPNFATAVELHRLVDAIRQASDTGREATFG